MQLPNFARLPGLKGHLVFWQTDTKSEVARADFEDRMKTLGSLRVPTGKRKDAPVTYVDLIPKNEYRSALARALKKFVSQYQGDLDEKDVTRFIKPARHGGVDSAGFHVAFTQLLPAAAGDDAEDMIKRLKLAQEAVVAVSKKTGSVTYAGDVPQEARQQIKSLYQNSQQNLDHDHFNYLVDRILRSQVNGVLLRNHSRVFYVSEKDLEHMETFRTFFSLFPEHTLFEIQVFQTPETNDAIEKALCLDFLKEVEEFKRSVLSSTERGLEPDAPFLNRKLAEIEALQKKVEDRKQDLHTQKAKIQGHISFFSKHLKTAKDYLTMTEEERKKVANFDLFDAVMGFTA